MGSVYGGSSLNIAAASAKNGTIGCFSNRNEQVLRSVRGVQVTVPGGPPQLVHENDFYRSAISNGPLAQRLWILQERILAPRIIWFSERGIFWGCRENSASEMFQSKFPDHWPFNRNIENLSARWYNLVADYTKGKLTHDSDKLIAISGLAQAVQKETGNDYTWGLWRRDLELQLCWGLRMGIDGSYAGPLESRAPSWSWPSVNGATNFQTQSVHGISEISDLNGRRLIHIVHITTAPIEHFPLEGIQSKKLRILCGPLIGAKETLVNKSQSPQVILAQTPVRVAWISYRDVPAKKSEEPRDPVHLLPILRFPLMVPHYEHRFDGLILKKTTDGVNGQLSHERLKCGPCNEGSKLHGRGVNVREIRRCGCAWKATVYHQHNLNVCIPYPSDHAESLGVVFKKSLSDIHGYSTRTTRFSFKIVVLRKE